MLNIQPITFGVSFILYLQSQSQWSLLNGTWQKRPRTRHQIRFEKQEITLQMQYAVRLSPTVCFILNASHHNHFTIFEHTLRIYSRLCHVYITFTSRLHHVNVTLTSRLRASPSSSSMYLIIVFYVCNILTFT